MTHPSFGPLSPEQFHELVEAPFGKAVEAIRKFDPLFGRSKGEKASYRVKVARTIVETGSVIVEAEDEDEAEDIALQMAETNSGAISWQYDSEDGAEIIDVEAA